MILFRSLLQRFFRYGINGNISKRKPWIVVQASLMQLHKWRSQLRGSLFTWFHFPQFICIIYFIYISHKKFCVTSADKRFWCWKLWILMFTNLIWQFYNFFFPFQPSQWQCLCSQLDGLFDNNLFILLPTKGL